MGSASASRGWLFGPAPDLLIGCGLAYLAVMGAQGVFGEGLRAVVPPGVLILLCSVPHYGATLLRVYGSAEERRRYTFFTVWTTLLLAALFLLGLRSAVIGSWILTIYLTWSPWHYSGQNYGIALMLLGRRGASPDPLTKRLLYASFVFSFLLTFLALHRALPEEDIYAPVSLAGVAYEVLALDIPDAIAVPGIAVLLAGYLGVLGLVVVRMLRRSPARALLPLAAICLTQAAWFVFPVTVRQLGLLSGDSPALRIYTPYGFVWIAAFHAIQYLWVTTYYATAAGKGPSRPRYLLSAMLAGAAVWFLPGLLFAPGYLGRIAYDSGLALLIASIVNLHHFVLDGAIWKLRDGRVARLLIRPAAAATEAAATPRPAPRRSLLGIPIALWAVGGVALSVALLDLYEARIGLPRAEANKDVVAAEAVVARLGWIGRDGPNVRRKLARLRAETGDPRGAVSELERSLAYHPSSFRDWITLARLHESLGEPAQAIRAYETALELVPSDVSALFRSGVLHLENGRPERALPLLERAREHAPDRELIRLRLEQARAAVGDGDGDVP